MFEEISLSLISEVQVWHLDLDKHERTNEVGWYSSILTIKKETINKLKYINIIKKMIILLQYKIKWKYD